MIDKVFIDTNIFIYAYSNSEIDKRDLARKLLAQDNISISTQVINEFIWIMSRKYNIDVNLINSIIKSFFKKYYVDIVTEDVIYKAIYISNHYDYTYWDSLMLSSSLNGGCNKLYTEDMHHNQLIEDELKIINPFKE